jgi:hypothetical protein
MSDFKRGKTVRSCILHYSNGGVPTCPRSASSNGADHNAGLDVAERNFGSEDLPRLEDEGNPVLTSLYVVTEYVG